MTDPKDEKKKLKQTNNSKYPHEEAKELLRSYGRKIAFRKVHVTETQVMLHNANINLDILFEPHLPILLENRRIAFVSFKENP